MIASKQEIYSVLREFNPWWDSVVDPDLPAWRRVAFDELREWMQSPPSPRAVLISGARQVGKTTMFRQLAALLIDSGVDPEQVFYATFDHPLLKLVGLDQVVSIWEEFHVRERGTEYLLLDEIQYTSNWQIWIKHQVDFNKKRRIAVTGSAMPLNSEDPESGVGRWHTIKLPTLSFYEYLKIKDVRTPDLGNVRSLREVLSWPEAERIKTAELAKPLIPHFQEYLLRGGFPETARVARTTTAQKLLREDIVDKVLKRDMTALYGVRHVLDLEKVFLYLCLHDGGILDVKHIAENLAMSRTKVNNFLALLESAHLIYKLPRLGDGKQVLKGPHKVYLADAAIAGSVLLRGNSLLENNALLGTAVETAFFKHLFTRLYPMTIRFSYWRQPKFQHEVDIVAEVAGDLIPFEVKYRSSISGSDLKGIRALCQHKNLRRAYVITRELSDFRVVTEASATTQYLHIPAVLACFWLSKSELE
jgi:predicted AAA+ superfamily ATPase